MSWAFPSVFSVGENKFKLNASISIQTTVHPTYDNLPIAQENIELTLRFLSFGARVAISEFMIRSINTNF